jgi:hypothetical protein
MNRLVQFWFGTSLCLGLLAAVAARAVEPNKDQLIKDLEKTLSGAKMTGQFTVTGKDDKPPAKEEYTITFAQKLPEGDLWLIKANIKYGKTDKTFPIPLEIKWAGDTPVITLTNLAIPGLGTFSSRVVIYEGRYAGTWQHDQVGGHLYGTIEKGDEKKDEPKNDEPKKDNGK